MEFYRDNEIQNADSVIARNEESFSTKIKDIVKTDDTLRDDEESEENLFCEDIDTNLLKCRLIKQQMLPLTMAVTRELYNQCKTNISYEKVLYYVKIMSKYRKRKGMEDKSEKIAKSILDFLNRNDIIESDEAYQDRFYFTILGNTYMNYFMNGII